MIERHTHLQCGYIYSRLDSTNLACLVLLALLLLSSKRPLVRPHYSHPRRRDLWQGWAFLSSACPKPCVLSFLPQSQTRGRKRSLPSLSGFSTFYILLHSPSSQSQFLRETDTKSQPQAELNLSNLDHNSKDKAGQSLRSPRHESGITRHKAK
jgi:hypothetical protein